MSDTTLLKRPAEGQVHHQNNCQPKTIVVAEDDRFQRAMICDLLESHGYNVVAFAGGNRALKAATALKAEIIVTDLMMEEGEDISTIIEARQKDNPIRILAISANARYLKYADKLGADCTMQKPIDVDQFVRNVSSLLAE